MAVAGSLSRMGAPGLALDGGDPVRRGPLSPWPYFADDETAAVMEVLRSGKVNYWTGQESREFEREFAAWCGSRHAVALHNGTVALELALLGLGIGEGDEVILTPRTFIASASAAVLQGARPVFADVDPDSQNITAESIRKVLTPRTRAIIAVHLGGWPCDMGPIMALAGEYGLKVIEDCAQAHGATIDGRSIGSFGHAAAWSFCQDKIVTTGGEGGMLTTDDAALWDRAWSYKDHGKSFTAVYHRQHPPGFRWVHESFGTNWRMLEVQAAIGRIQMRKLADWTARRQAHAATLTADFRQMPALRVTEPPPSIDHAYYKYYVFVRPEMLREGWDRDRIMAAINAEGIPCFSGSCSEIYLEKAFENTGFRPAERLPVAKALGETSLMFMVHPTLTHDEIQDTCRAVEKVLEAATA